MEKKVFLVGDSIEIKLLREALEEKGIEILYYKKKDFKLDVSSTGNFLIVYELSPEEIEKSASVEALIRKVRGSIILLTQDISLEKAIEFIRAGARDLKLLNTPLELLEKTVFYWLKERNLLEGEEIFLTKDSKMLKILGALEEVAKTKAPVLLLGESGTGKELLAKHLHKKGLRKDGPFIPINCAALPETLLESELFGFEKGAFSGAFYQKKGKIELAHSGTLFLDEIGELSLNLQAKLLRVLQEGEIERLGSYHPVKVDFRLISATNKNLEKEVKDGRFREDLFYRINVITVKIPSLRERKADVKFLALYFLEKFSLEYQKKFKGFTEEAVKFLEKYPFPGKVRELKNMIERAVITCFEDRIDVKYLTNPWEEDVFLEEEKKGEEEKEFFLGINFDNIFEEIKPLEEVEREFILKALKLTKGNKSKAAELLGITVRTLRNKLKEYRERGLISEEEVF